MTPWATPRTVLFSQVPRGRFKNSPCGGHFTEALGGWDSASSGNNRLSLHDGSCVAWQEVRGRSLPSRTLKSSGGRQVLNQHTKNAKHNDKV